MNNNSFYVYGLFYRGDKYGLENCFYIGKGKNSRMYHHFRKSVLNKHSKNNHKSNKIKSLKNKNISPYPRKIATELSEDRAYELERFLIGEIGLENLVNLTVSKSCATSGENHPRYGVTLKDETKKKISNSHKGKGISKKHRDKISKANSGKGNPMYGKERSKETKKKLSEINSGKNAPWYEESHSNKTKEKMSQSHRGEGNASSKLTKKEVKEIKWYLNNTDLYQRQIADKYSVSSKQISNIKRKERWSHVKETKKPK